MREREKHIIETLRGEGWMVAVHNDYRLGGVLHTFYLFTHPSGVWAKGEGESDYTALVEAALDAASRRTAAIKAGLWPSGSEAPADAGDN